MTAIKDLTGQKFGKLTVLYRAENHVSKNGNTRVTWHCQCDCGNELDVMALNLTRNHTVSCGCSRADGRKKLTRDITGERFGNLTGIRKIENTDRTKWLFKCDCGNEVIAYLSNVTSGKTLSCGKKCGLKIQNPISDKPKGYSGDLTGQRFGRLFVKQKLENENGYTMFLCLCDCGNEKVVRGNYLKYGTTKSCGCLHKEVSGKSNFENLIGYRFGKLEVIAQAPSKYDKIHWLCKCDCGNETLVSTTGLKSGHTQSCGCFQDEVASNTHFVDLSGRTFGKLTVLKRIDNSNTGLVRYLCQCECGNTTDVIGGHLVGGNIQSCGCWVYSKLEEYVINYFNKIGYSNSVDYECQKKFDNLVGNGGKPLSYDFLVYSNGQPRYLIECQGKQHYEPIDYFGGEDSFKRQQEHDKLKAEYASQIGIELLEIPYTYTSEEIEKMFISLGIL